jgi:hypothetical protein
MKINHILFLTLAMLSTIALGMEPIEQQEAAQEAKAGLVHLPPEIQIILLKELTKAETKEEALKNIKNLFETHRVFQLLAGDIAANKVIIYQLAQKYFNGNLKQAALALNTPGAKLWLAQYTKGALDVLPAELRLEQVKAIASPPLPLKQAIANIKTYYLAHPPSQQSVGITKAILTHLMNEYHEIDANELQKIVDTLAKRETMTVFKNPEMIAWIHQQKERLDKEEELGRAAQKRDVKRVKELLSQGINVNVKLGNRGTPLDAAFSFSFSGDNINEMKKLNEVLEALLNAGADANGAYNGHPLSGAIQAHSTAIVEKLLKAGASPNSLVSGSNGLTALAVAAMKLAQELHGEHGEWGTTYVAEYKEIIRLLLQAGANRNISGSFPGSIQDFVNHNKNFPHEEKAEVINEIYKEQK